MPGVGIEEDNFFKMGEKERQKKRESLGVPPGRVVLLTSGEMIPRKNQEVLFRMLAKLKDSEKESVLSLERNETADEQEDAGTGRRVERCSYERLHLLLCGHGELKEYLQDLAAQLGIADHISFLGYREDMAEIFGASDIFLFPSFQEGLPRAMLEAMASGLPVVCSEIRGNTDLMGEEWTLSEDGSQKICPGGMMIEKMQDEEVWARALLYMLEHMDEWDRMGEVCRKRSRLFGLDAVGEKMEKIYKRLLGRESERG